MRGSTVTVQGVLGGAGGGRVRDVHFATAQQLKELASSHVVSENALNDSASGHVDSATHSAPGHGADIKHKTTKSGVDLQDDLRGAMAMKRIPLFGSSRPGSKKWSPSSSLSNTSFILQMANVILKS